MHDQEHPARRMRSAGSASRRTQYPHIPHRARFSKAFVRSGLDWATEMGVTGIVPQAVAAANALSGGNQESRVASTELAAVCCSASPSAKTSLRISRAPSLSPISWYALARSNLVCTSYQWSSFPLGEDVGDVSVPR